MFSFIFSNMSANFGTMRRDDDFGHLERLNVSEKQLCLTESNLHHHDCDYVLKMKIFMKFRLQFTLLCLL